MSNILKKIYDETPKEQLQRFRYAKRIGEYIYSFLKNEDKSQADLAKDLKMKPAQLNRYINGEANLTLETIAKLEIGIGHKIINIRKPLTYGEGVVQTWQIERSNNNDNDSEIYKMVDHQELPHESKTSTTEKVDKDFSSDNQVYSLA
jgi:transcriptional regulator with XRE-family HTH domain